MSTQLTAPTTTTEQGFAPIGDATSAAFSLLRVSALLSDELDRELQARADMTLSEMLVLAQLMLVGGRLTMAELADAVVVTRGGVTKIVDRLVEAGLVERVPSRLDRRVIHAQVTDLARQRVRRNQRVFEEIAQSRLATLLDPSELKILRHMVDRLSCENPGWEPPELEAQREDRQT